MKKLKSNLIFVIFFVTVFLLILFISSLVEFSAYDEIWNFQSIYKMWYGELIYVDNNVLITPIFFLLGNLIFHIFGANLFIFRIYNTFIFLLNVIFIFLIFRKLGSNKTFSCLYCTFYIILNNSIISCGANYNILAITFILLGIFCYITFYEKKYYHLLQGIILFLTFFTKQTIGIYYAFGIVLFEIMDTGFNTKFFKNQFLKLASFLPCLLVSLFIMFIKGNLIDFLNMCFGSILEFGSSNHSFHSENWQKIVFMIISIAFSIFLLIKVKTIPYEIKRNIKFLLCLSIALSFNMFPLANNYHVSMSLTFYILLFIYSLDSLLIREIFTSKSQNYTIALICFIMLYISFIKLGYTYFSNNIYMKQFDKNHPFYNAPVWQSDLDKINDMTDYISKKKEEGTNALVLSYEAATYMVPLHLNNNEFDLLFVGNLGYNGIQNTIDKISKRQNTEFLIFTNEDDCFWQESTEIREYIMNNLQKTGEFLNYSIYINK